MTLRTDRPGIALLIVMLLTMVVAAIAAGAALIGANSYLINQYDSQASLLEATADAGLELARARLNANPGLYSDSAPVTLERDAVVYDAAGAPIRGITRTVHSIPLGGGLGEYGNHAALVSIAEDGEGTRAIRRLDLLRESFAVYGYFTDHEPDNIAFGNGDRLYGQVHSNSDLKTRASGATFHGPVTTAGGFVGAAYATFLDDTTSHVLPIPMPTEGHLARLRSRVLPRSYVFTSSDGGDPAQATLRIEFVARDIDGDGVEEGFFRVYSSSDAAWVTGDVQTSMAQTANCGHIEKNGKWRPLTSDATGPGKGKGQGQGQGGAGRSKNETRRCFLGGSEMFNANPGHPDGRFAATDSRGAWRPYPGAVHPDVAATQPDAGYLFPIDRRIDPRFRGLIFVDGKVVVSGTVRGRVTLVASGNIIIGDDVVYATDPGAGTCEDILGLVSAQRIIVADNTLNSPQPDPRQPNSPDHTWDDTPDETIHASILALDRFEAENPGSGSRTAEPCNGVAWGRGCLNLTGGLIQQTRGPVAYSYGTGYIKRYTHDTCAFTAPPPYFPSTGHFYRGRYHEVDPTGFAIQDYFDALN